MEPVDGDGTAFGIFENSDDVAAAMCEVVVSRRSKTSTWVRHLQLWLRPQLDDEVAAGEISAVGQALELFVESIKGVIELKVKHAATTMKVYGRTPDQMKFLQLAAANMQQRLTAHEISMEGRFLVLTTKKVAP